MFLSFLVLRDVPGGSGHLLRRLDMEFPNLLNGFIAVAVVAILVGGLVGWLLGLWM